MSPGVSSFRASYFENPSFLILGQIWGFLDFLLLYINFFIQLILNTSLIILGSSLFKFAYCLYFIHFFE